MNDERQYISGLDLGKLSDPSAFALNVRRRPLLAKHNELQVLDCPAMGPQKVVVPPRTPFSGQLTKPEQRQRLWSYNLTRMKRWDVGTDYDDILEWLVKVYSKPPSFDPKVRGGLAGTTLAVDYTGVGVPIVEWLRKEMRLAGAKAIIRPIWIQSGKKAKENNAGGWNVPKVDLVGVLQMLMGTGRLTIEEEMENREMLLKEFNNFKEKQDQKTGNISYEAWRSGDHDDMVLAEAISLWVGECGQQEFFIA